MTARSGTPSAEGDRRGTRAHVPVLLPEVLAALGRWAAGGDRSDRPVAVELLAAERAGLRVRRCDGADAAPGLALAVGARIARLHGGEITADDPVPTTLTLWLPRARGGN